MAGRRGSASRIRHPGVSCSPDPWHVGSSTPPMDPLRSRTESRFAPRGVTDVHPPPRCERGEGVLRWSGGSRIRGGAPEVPHWARAAAMPERGALLYVRTARMDTQPRGGCELGASGAVLSALGERAENALRCTRRTGQGKESTLTPPPTAGAASARRCLPRNGTRSRPSPRRSGGRGGAGGPGACPPDRPPRRGRQRGSRWPSTGT